jgi:hypothetical protein
VGASDAHDVIRYMVGQGRTYIRAKDMEPGNIDMGEAINNFIKGKVMVCFGLQVEINVDSVYGPGDLVDASDHITVNVRVLGPSWTMANRVSLYSNGKKIKEATISRGGAPGIKYDTTWILQKPGNDVFLAAVAEGPDPARPFWQIAKPFQHDTPEWTPHVIGSSGAVWIEADDDGHFTSAFEYATKSVQDSRNDLPALMKSLERYDEAVSVQAAAILYQNGIDMTGPAVTAALLHASAETKEGFERFISEINRMK